MATTHQQVESESVATGNFEEGPRSDRNGRLSTGGTGLETSAPQAESGLVVPRLLLDGAGSIRQTTQRLSPPQDTEVLVRVDTVGLCATDLALYNGAYRGPRADPLCFGHEWAGVVEQVGDEATQLKVGDKVVGECLLACGQCSYCARDPNLCRNVRKFGITEDGAARGAVVLEEAFLHRVDDDADLGLMALAEPLAVGIHAVARGAAAHDAPLRDARVLVLGAGMIGLSCLAALRFLHGCEGVVVAEPIDERLAHALLLGALPAEGRLDAPPADDSQAAFLARFDLAPIEEPGFDVVINTTTSAEALRQGLRVLLRDGTLVSVGFVESCEICPRQLTLQGQRIVGSLGGTGHFDEAIGLLEQHADQFRSLITDRFAFADAESAFATALDRNAALKVQLRADS